VDDELKAYGHEAVSGCATTGPVTSISLCSHRIEDCDHESQFEPFFCRAHNLKRNGRWKLVYDNEFTNALPYILDSFVELIQPSEW